MNTPEQCIYPCTTTGTSPDTIVVKEACREEILLPAHTHAMDQIVFTTSGTLRIDIGGKILFVPEHHVACIPREVTHTLSSNNRRVSATIIYTSCDPAPAIAVYQSSEQITALLKFIHESCPSRIEREKLPQIHRFLHAFIQVIPSMCRTSEIPLTFGLVADHNRIRPILDYIAGHCHEELRMSELARRFGYSERSLSRLFKQAGIRFTHCVNTHRITQAIELMAEGNIPLRKIAYSTGFNTPSSFNRVFKQITGRTPGEFSREKENIKTLLTERKQTPTNRHQK